MSLPHLTASHLDSNTAIPFLFPELPCSADPVNTDAQAGVNLDGTELHFTDTIFLSSCTTIIKTVSEGDMIWCDQVIKCLKGLWHICKTENDWRGEMRTLVEWNMSGRFLNSISHPSPLQAATMVYKSFCIDCAAACSGSSIFTSCFLPPLIKLLLGESTFKKY